MRSSSIAVVVSVATGLALWGSGGLSPINHPSPGRPGGPTPAQAASAQAALAAKAARLEHRGPKKPAPDQPDAAAAFFVDQRVTEGPIPIAHLRHELDAVQARQAASLDGPSAMLPGGITSWSALGPGNIGGRTRSILIDPTDPSVMYAGGVAGGVWKSTDGGASWNAADDMMLNLAVSSMAMDPADPTVLYAGTGEGYLAGGMVQGLGIFKSTDAGATWNQLSGTVTGVPFGAFDYVNDVIVSANDSNTVYAGTRTGVWRSTDGGTNWSVLLANPWYVAGPSSSVGCYAGCLDLVARTDTSPDTLIASFGSLSADGIYRSTDGGTTWSSWGANPANQGRTSIAIAPSDQDVVYLSMADNGAVNPIGQLVEVYRSTDGGATYTPQLSGSNPMNPWLLSNISFALGCYGTDSYSQGWYDNAIAVDPTDPDVVWVGGIDLFRSDDAGVNFEIAGYWEFYTSSPEPDYYLHADQHAIVFHPGYDGTTNQTMFVGNDGGVFRTQNALAATSIEDCPVAASDPLPAIVWENLNNGYAVTQFYHGDAAQGGVDTFIAGAQDNGTDRVESASTPDSWDLIFGGDGGYCAIDPSDDQTMYIEYQFFPTIHKSVDGGDSFFPAQDGLIDADGLFITPFAMDPSDPDILWTGGSRPFRTVDGANNWFLVGPDFPAGGTISAIAVAPSDSNVVYVGFDNGVVARTTDGLAASPTWTEFSAGLQSGWVSSLAVHPTDPDVAYATYSTYFVQHVLKTDDGGATWTSIDGIGFTGVPDIPVHWIAVRACNPSQLYVGTELGVFASDDDGATWGPANAGLANTVVESLDWQDGDTLVAFTYGRGAFRTTLIPCLPGMVTPIGCGVNPAGSLTVSGLPNLGDTIQLEVHDPVGTIAPLNLTFAFVSTLPDPAFPPCGTQVPGWGLGAGPAPVGELLIDIGAPNPAVALTGNSWLGTPVPIPLPIPTNPGLAGQRFYVQGALFEISTGRVGVTEGHELTIGS